MSTTVRALATYLIVVASVLAHGSNVGAGGPDWKAVEQALGKSGQALPGDVFRVGMPRTDLSVTVKGVPVKAGFALGSYAAFKQMSEQAMVMGDLVLLDQEIPAVMSALFAGGLQVTALHNHLNDISPHVMYMHYEGHGDAAKLARALRQALSTSGTPLGTSASASTAPAPPWTPGRSSRHWVGEGETWAMASSRSRYPGRRPLPRVACRSCPQWES